MNAGERFSLELAKRFPLLGVNFDYYYDDPETFLEHLYFGLEVTPLVIAAYVTNPDGDSNGKQLDWRGVITFLNEKLRSGDLAIGSVIGTSFVWQLPHPGQEGYSFVGELDDELARLFNAVRPHG